MPSNPQESEDAGVAIHAVPPEILSQIFHSLISDIPWTRPRIAEGPLLLCNVSSFWRTTALASPELWDNLVVTFRDPSVVASTTGAARSWLSRARSRKLSIWIYFFHSISANPIAEIIAPHESHISVLRLTSAPIGCLQSMLEFPPGSFPLLRILTIEFPPPHFSWARKPGSSTDTLLFPQLEEFTVGEGWTLLNIHLMPINWAQLTTLSVKKSLVSLPLFCAVLTQCTSLASCFLEIRHLLEDIPVVQPTLLPRLTTLHLQLTRRFDDFLPYFTFPALETAVLATTPAATLAATPPVRVLAAIASTALRRLAIRIPCDPDVLLAVLGGAPDLEELHMCFDRRVVSALAASAEFVPRLAFITCILTHGDSEHAAEGQEFADMITARWRRLDVVRPRTVAIIPNTTVGWNTARDRLVEALADGLLLQVRAPDDLSFSSE